MIFEMKSLLNELNTRLDTAKEKVGKRESIIIEFIQYKTLRDMRLKIKLP